MVRAGELSPGTERPPTFQRTGAVCATAPCSAEESAALCLCPAPPPQPSLRTGSPVLTRSRKRRCTHVFGSLSIKGACSDAFESEKISIFCFDQGARWLTFGDELTK